MDKKDLDKYMNDFKEGAQHMETQIKKNIVKKASNINKQMIEMQNLTHTYNKNMEALIDDHVKFVKRTFEKEVDDIEKVIKEATEKQANANEQFIKKAVEEQVKIQQETTKKQLDTYKDSVKNAIDKLDQLPSTSGQSQESRGQKRKTTDPETPLYRDEHGCVLVMRHCKYERQDCTYKDITSKCLKHEAYFCKWNTDCKICAQVHSEASLSRHYTLAHRNISSAAGYPFRVRRTTNQKWNYWIVRNDADIFICSYKLYENLFTLQVYTEIASWALEFFSCEVKVIDPASEHERTFTCSAMYGKWHHDWYISIRKEQFTWSNELDVIVTINKKE